MKININHSKKHINIWVGHADDPHVDINHYIEQYPEYDIAIFRSGKCDLAEATAKLLFLNQ